jgi:hypothetical protein
VGYIFEYRESKIGVELRKKKKKKLVKKQKKNEKSFEARDLILIKKENTGG